MSGAAFGGVLWSYVPVLLAVGVSVAGGVWARGKRARWLPAVGSAAVLVGWAMLMPSWRAWVRPQGLAEHLVMAGVAAVAAAVAGVWLAGRPARWAGTGAIAFGGWWLAGAAGARPEFWRVWFGVGAAAWVLRRLGAGASRPAFAGALTLWLGLVAAGAPGIWSGVALVLAGAFGAAAAVGAGGIGVPGLLGVAVVAADLGAGALVRGGVGFVDLVCGAALLAPGLLGRVERGLGGRVTRLGRAGGVVGPVVTAVVGVVLAWVAARVIRP